MCGLACMADEHQHAGRVAALQTTDLAAHAAQSGADDPEARELVRASDRHEIAATKEPLVSTAPPPARYRGREKSAFEEGAQRM